MDRWINKGNHAIVEAIQLTPENVEEIAAWTGGFIVNEEDKISNRMYDALNIPTPIGNRRLSLHMYVVKFQGEFYVAQRGQFEGQYSRMTPIITDPREAKKLPKFQKEPWFDAPKPGDPNYTGE